MDREEVLRLAKLARVELEDSEVEAIARDLERIVAYVDRLGSVELPASREDGAHYDTDVHREDRVGPCLDLEETLLNAPDTDGSFFLVPRVVERP